MLIKNAFLFIALCALSFLLKAQSNADTLRKHVVRLSTLPFARNMANPTSLYKASAYIEAVFLNQTSRVVAQNYLVDKEPYRNIICSFGPDTGYRIIVGAHYDVFGEAPGADGNASGVTGLLALAALLKKQEKNLRYRIDLVAYTLGEMPTNNYKMMGSYKHAQSLAENKIPIIGMIDLKGIGYFTDRPRSQRYPFFAYRWMHGRVGNFIGIVQEPGGGLWGRQIRGLCQQYVKGLRTINFKPAVPFKGFTEGDHKNYKHFGFAFVLLTNTTFYRNK